MTRVDIQGSVFILENIYLNVWHQFPVRRHRYADKSFMRCNTNLSSLPSTGFLGSGSLLSVLQPFKPFTEALPTEACAGEQCNPFFNFEKIIAHNIGEVAGIG